MNNLQIYNATRTAPPEALKAIQAGRLKGKSDINPMWRIKALTEQFGPCGVGWRYEITRKWLEPGGNGETAAFVDVNLFFKYNGEWSFPIPGTGGSSFIAQESKGPYLSDECFKMALTDALSVCCKALGFAADVYWEKDKSKYDQRPEAKKQEEVKPPPPSPLDRIISGIDWFAEKKKTAEELTAWYKNDDGPVMKIKVELDADGISAANKYYEQIKATLPSNNSKKAANF